MNASSRELELMLGQRLDVVVGREYNLYFEGLLPCRSAEDWELTISSEIGGHFSNRWSVTPEKAQIGNHPLTIRYRDLYSQKQVSASCEVRVHDAHLGGSHFRWLPVGDSITHAALYVQATVANAAEIGTVLKTQGTQCFGQDETIKHEGYPGWKFGDFLGPDFSTRANFQELTASAFSFENEPGFAFKKYLDTHLKGEEPDFVTILLGANDIALLDDVTRLEGIHSSLRCAEILAERIIRHTRNTRLGFILPLAPSSQDAFGTNYGCRIPRWLYRKNQRALVQALRERFADFHDRVSCISAHFNIDPYFGYPLKKERANIHSDRLRLVNTNAMHPSRTGHRQIAESLLAWMIGQNAD